METTFVAQLSVPAALHAGRDKRLRQQLTPADEWGVDRGYWDIWYTEGRYGADEPGGLLLTIQVGARTPEHAEDQALRVAGRLGQLAAFFGGAPPRHPRLIRMAEVDGDDTLIAQWNYYYDSTGSASIELRPPELHEFLRRMAELDEPLRSTLELAARWYAISTGGLSVLDQYLSAWIGLESIGPTINSYYHPVSTKIRCEVCENKPGARRDRGMAGIEHLLRRVAIEIFGDRDFTALHELRSQIAYGLRPASELEVEVSDLVPDLQLALGAGTLAARAGPTDEPTYGWTGALPRDYEERPDAALETRPPEPLQLHEPYFGGWIELTRKLMAPTTDVSEAGEVHYGGTLDVHFTANVPHGSGIVTSQFGRRYRQFSRSGVTFEIADKNVQPAQPVLSEEWRPRGVSPAWERVRLANLERDATTD